MQSGEVLDVVGDDEAIELTLGPEQVGILLAFKWGIALGRLGVMASAAELLGDADGEQLIQQELHLRRDACSRPHCAYRRSASSRVRWTPWSICFGNSA